MMQKLDRSEVRRAKMGEAVFPLCNKKRIKNAFATTDSRLEKSASDGMSVLPTDDGLRLLLSLPLLAQ